MLKYFVFLARYKIQRRHDLDRAFWVLPMPWIFLGGILKASWMNNPLNLYSLDFPPSFLSFESYHFDLDGRLTFISRHARKKKNELIRSLKNEYRDERDVSNGLETGSRDDPTESLPRNIWTSRNCGRLLTAVLQIYVSQLHAFARHSLAALQLHRDFRSRHPSYVPELHVSDLHSGRSLIVLKRTLN